MEFHFIPRPDLFPRVKVELILIAHVPLQPNQTTNETSQTNFYLGATLSYTPFTYFITRLFYIYLRGKPGFVRWIGLLFLFFIIILGDAGIKSMR